MCFSPSTKANECTVLYYTFQSLLFICVTVQDFKLLGTVMRFLEIKRRLFKNLLWFGFEHDFVHFSLGIEINNSDDTTYFLCFMHVREGYLRLSYAVWKMRWMEEGGLGGVWRVWERRRRASGRRVGGYQASGCLVEVRGGRKRRQAKVWLTSE